MKLAGHYINLDTSQERRLEFENQLNALDIEKYYSRFDATAFDAQITSRMIIPTHTTKPLFCNWLSHLEIMKRHKEVETLLHICEDDAQFSQNFPILIEQLQLPNDWDLVLLDFFLPKNINSHQLIHNHLKKYKQSNAISVISLKELGYNGGMSSYLVNPHSINKLLQLLDPLQAECAHIDYQLSLLIQQGSVNAYTILPFFTTLSEYAKQSTLQEDQNDLIEHAYSYRNSCFIDTFSSVKTVNDVFLEYLRISFDAAPAHNPLETITQTKEEQTPNPYKQELLFPAPFQITHATNCEELNKGLLEDIQRFCTTPNDGYRSSYGGLRSYENIFEDPSPYIQALLPHIQNAISHYLSVNLSTMIKVGDNVDFDIEVIPWAYLLKEGDFMKPHMHPNGLITGVYYVKIPTIPENSEEGTVVFMSPDTGRSMVPNPTSMIDSVTLKPKEGDLVIFPSYLPHYVNPLKQGERAVIAFDVKLLSKQK